MGVFSVISVFTLFVLHVVVISNQVNVVVSGSQNGTSISMEHMFKAEKLVQQIARDHALSQNKQLTVNQIIATTKERLDKRVDDWVKACKSSGGHAKSDVKTVITSSIIGYTYLNFAYLPQDGMDQIANAISR